MVQVEVYAGKSLSDQNLLWRLCVVVFGDTVDCWLLIKATQRSYIAGL